jgi:cytochrome c
MIAMKLSAVGSLIALAAIAPAWADEPVGFAQGTKLMVKYNCQSCHSADKTLAGPSLHDIAKRYASDPNAPGELEEKVRNGSSGAWDTSALPMPPTQVPDADLKPLVEWILSLRQY